MDDLSDSDIADMRAAGFEATTDSARLREAKTIVICVPTPLSEDGGPFFGPVVSAVRTIRDNLQPGMLVILESTTYPGTTDEVVRPILEETGLVAGQDFHLAFSPERIDPGNEKFGAKTPPRSSVARPPHAAMPQRRSMGSSSTRWCGPRAPARPRRRSCSKTLTVTSILRSSTRWPGSVATSASTSGTSSPPPKTKPFGFQAFYPGPGVGGHCIPIDPNYLSHNVRARLGYPFRFVELAQEINATMPAYVVQRAQNLLNEDSKPLRGSTCCSSA